MKERIDIEAVKLACRFAYGCNSARLHSDKNLMNKMRQCIKTGNVDDLIDRFNAIPDLNVYTKTIAQVLDLPQYSYPVMEAYWFGNDLLHNFTPEHYDVLLENYANQGIKSALLEMLKTKRPKVFIPNHTFSVLHYDIDPENLGDEFNLRIVRGCMVRMGNVLDLNQQKAKIKILTPYEHQGKLRLIQQEASLPVDHDFTPDLQVGNTVAVHLTNIVKVLSKGEKQLLSDWNERTLELMF